MVKHLSLHKLSTWMDILGYTWVEGQEQIYKAEMLKTHAQDLLDWLYARGAVRRVGE